MKHVLAGTLAILATPALAMAQALDCAALGNSAGAMPSGYPQHCLGLSVAKGAPPWQTWLPDGETGHGAYTVQLGATSEVVDQGFYRFPLDGAGAVEPINVQPGFANMYGLDFNPAATRLYGVQHLLNGSPHRIVTVNTQTGVATTLGFLSTLAAIAPRDQVTGLSIDPRTGDAWITTVNLLTNNPQLTEARLWRVNLHSSAPTLVGRLLPDELRAIFIDLAIDCQGRMFAHNISDDSLYRINPADASAERIGTHGQDANFAQGMDFDNSNGELYAWLHTSGGNTTLGRFDLETGAFSAIAPAPAGQWEGAIPGTCAPKSIDADALTGAWYAPYTNGQGFTARYFPGSGDVFMPWFTFAIANDDDDDDDDDTPRPNVHRWYVLFGQLEPGADTNELELAITQATAGSFDEPPGAPSEVVGQARLQMLSCNQGVLDYQFDEGHNEGVSGRLSMTRLLPQGEACTDYDGQVKPATGAYDPALTGSWYDPATPGQGIELFRIPRNIEAGISGLLYGAWFTFAPAASEDAGPVRQRWFTFDGQTVEPDGSIKTAIVHTPGGSFDQDPSIGVISHGTAKIKVEACNRLTLTYEFADAEIAGDFRDKSGEITLHRLGPCPSSDD